MADSEQRSIHEVELTIEAVRAGLPVQVDYWDGETDEDPYLQRMCY